MATETTTTTTTNTSVSREMVATLVAAAVHSVAPMTDATADRAAWKQSVTAVLEDLTREALTGSFARTVEQVATEVTFPATIVRVTRERSSNRALVHLKVTPSKYSPDGTQTIRTDRLENAAAVDLATNIRNNLIGHRVTIWKRTEASDRGRSVDVLCAVADRGIDNNAEVA